MSPNQLSLSFCQASDFRPMYRRLARQGLIKLDVHTTYRNGRGAFGEAVYALSAALLPALPDAPTQLGGDLNGRWH